MEILLVKGNCLSLSGMLGQGYGYYIRSTKKGRFYSQRSKHSVPYDGHWRFILACAEIAHAKLHIEDIQVSCAELILALREARHFVAAESVFQNAEKQVKLTYDARDIINLKTTFSL